MNIPSGDDGLEKVHPIYLVLESRLKERLRLSALGNKDARLKNDLISDIAPVDAKYEALASGLSDGFLELDSDGRIIFINQAALAMFGAPRETFLGRFYTDVISLEDGHGAPVAEGERPIYQALHLGRRASTRPIDRYFYRRFTGGKFRVAVSASPIRVGRKTFGAVVVFRDITKDADIDKSKIDFVSLASHQLRSPLTTINWYVELLLERGGGKLTLAEKHYLDEIRKGSKKMNELVSGFSNVSRLESGNFAVEPEPVSAALLIRKIIDDNKSRIVDKKIKLSTKFLPIKKISLDPRLFRMVMGNILDNAIKHTSSGGKIAVAVNESSDYDQITVSDNGCGMSEEFLNNLFDVSYQIENHTSNTGIGLGLAIAKRAIELQGGSIIIKSTEGRGTTATLRLPKK